MQHACISAALPLTYTHSLKQGSQITDGVPEAQPTTTGIIMHSVILISKDTPCMLFAQSPP